MKKKNGRKSNYWTDLKRMMGMVVQVGVGMGGSALIERCVLLGLMVHVVIVIIIIIQ